MSYLTTHSTHFIYGDMASHISHREDSTYHGLWYHSRGTLDATRINFIGPPGGIDPTTHRTTSGRSTTELHLALTGNGVFLLEKTCYMHAICKVDIRYIIAQTINNRVMSFDYIGDNYCKFEYTGAAQHNPLFAKEGRKEMFYLTTHSTYFLIYGYKERKGKVLFNDALNTF